MTPTDTQLKSALVKMLPDKLGWLDTIGLIHIEKCGKANLCQRWEEPVKDTELLHLCWLVEETLNHGDENDEHVKYEIALDDIENQWWTANIHTTWQQRTIALCKVKGVEII